MIALTMRLTRHEYPNGTEEIRDALARDWWNFLEQALPGRALWPVPNIGENIAGMARALPLSGLILTGGEDWGVYPARDSTEHALLRLAQERSLPVLGVCRGAQVLNSALGGESPHPVSDHAGTRHRIDMQARAGLPVKESDVREVNSFHNMGLLKEDLAPSLHAWATAQDNTVEAFSSQEGLLCGILWHPERETCADIRDIQLFQYHFGHHFGRRHS